MDGQPLRPYPAGLNLAEVVYPAEGLGDSDLEQALLASNPLWVVRRRQVGLPQVYFVGSLEDAMRTLKGLGK